MSYTLRVHVREAEPYTGLYDYDDVRDAVTDEVRNTINELGSDILNNGTEAEREQAVELLTDRAMEDLWRQQARGDGTEHRLPGPVCDGVTGARRPGVKLSLQLEYDREGIS